MKQEHRNALLAGALAVACASLAPLSVAAVVAPTVPTGTSAAATASFDAVAEVIVASRIAAKRITAAQALLSREQLQLQFRALSPEAQASVLAKIEGSTGPESGPRAEKILMAETQRAARQALAVARGDTRGSGSDADEAAGNKPRAKLGPDGDYVFVPTYGPCRVADSRFAAAGPLGSTAARQLFAYSQSGGYDWSNQGGSGFAGSGNCVGTEFVGTTPPVAVVATVAVTNTSTGGSMRAWNGGTALTVGGVLGWNAGMTISNTTVIPVDRSITAYPGSGSKRDFGLYNNSGGAVDYIIDVVGYYAENRATQLDCYIEGSLGESLPNGTSDFFSAPACETGYEGVAVFPYAASFSMWTGTMNPNGCRISNSTGATQTVYCDKQCCRVPGR